MNCVFADCFSFTSLAPHKQLEISACWCRKFAIRSRHFQTAQFQTSLQIASETRSDDEVNFNFCVFLFWKILICHWWPPHLDQLSTFFFLIGFATQNDTHPCCCSSTNADLFGGADDIVLPSKYFGVWAASGVSIIPECGVLGGPS